jgi:hypothetical protein
MAHLFTGAVAVAVAFTPHQLVALVELAVVVVAHHKVAQEVLVVQV